MIDLIKKNKDILAYLFFGVCTTLINIVSYYLMAHILNLGVIVSSVIAWVLAVLFAYLTNRKMVFHSEAKTLKEICKEILLFFSCRVSTGILDILMMWLFVDIIGFNDVIIKMVSNVIVIILNYVFSKLIIFNGEKNFLMEFISRHRKEILISFIFLVISFIFLLISPLNPFVNLYSSGDSSVFRTIAMMMDKGYTPYLDTFDHKGPLLYIINYLGLKISYSHGVWYLEIVNLFVTLCALYKVARLKCNRTYSFISVMFIFPLLCYFFRGGNFTEEYAMSFISISLYIFLDYILNDKVTNIRLIICGFCLGSVLMLRPNMISVWIVYCLYILFRCLKGKKYKQLLNFILYFVIGLLFIILPIVLWLYSKGALDDFWNVYIKFNGEYTAKMGVGFLKRIKVFLYFSDRMFMIPFWVAVFYSLFIERKGYNYIFLIYIFLTLIFMSISGVCFQHYGMFFIPAIVYPYSILFKHINKKIFVIILVLVNIILFGIMLLENKMYIVENSGTEKKVSSFVKKCSDENDTISVYGNWDIIYLLSNRKHATRYSYQNPIDRISLRIRNDYFKQLKEEKPKLIVVERGKNKNVKDFVDNNNYSIIWHDNDDLNKSIVIYKLNDIY